MAGEESKMPGGVCVCGGEETRRRSLVVVYSRRYSTAGKVEKKGERDWREKKKTKRNDWKFRCFSFFLLFLSVQFSLPTLENSFFLLPQNLSQKKRDTKMATKQETAGWVSERVGIKRPRPVYWSWCSGSLALCLV